MKFTVVYSNYFTSGSHTHSLVNVLRIVVPDNANIAQVLPTYGVEMSQVQFIFEGWPKQEGETSDPVESKK